MTDKQIIMDGIDVGGCEHYEDLSCSAYRDSCGYPLDCENTNNCYYKQLKSKEQECEELKRQHQGDKGLITSTGKMNYQLLQEYDKLKTENDECIKDNEYLKTIIKDFTQEVVKLKAILTEIKEIVTLDKTSFKYAGSTISICDDILIKISEVEDEHNG